MLYHKEIGFGKSADSLIGRSFRLQYSGHAKQACLNDRYGVISKPPFNVQVTRDNLIEIETNSFGTPIKFVIRLHYDIRYDIAIVIIPDFDVGTVKSVWLNDRNDTHKTLNASLYSKPN